MNTTAKFVDLESRESFAKIDAEFATEFGPREWETLLQLRGRLLSGLYSCSGLLQIDGEIAAVKPVSGGRGDAWGLDFKSGRSVLLRFCRRGGWVRFLSGDKFLCSPLFSLRCSRPLLELEILNRLYSRGVRVPRPIAAHAEFCSAGFAYRGLLITELISSAQNLLSLLPGLAEEACGSDKFLRFCHEAGSQAGQMLRCNIAHADLHLGNVLVDKDQKVFIIDLDKAQQFGLDKARSEHAVRLAKRWLRSLQKHLAGRQRLMGLAQNAFESGMEIRD